MTHTKESLHSGILALWRPGTAEHVADTPFSEQQRQNLYTAGKIGTLTLLRAAYEGQGLVYPGISSITEPDFEGAKTLRDAAQTVGSVVIAIKFHQTQDSEVKTMRRVLTTGAHTLLRDLQDIFHAPIDLSNHHSSNDALIPHAGALYVPLHTSPPEAEEAANALRLTLPINS